MQTQSLDANGALIVLTFRTYSGRKKLEVSDLRLPEGTELPPSEVASLGSRKLVDASVIRHHQQPRDRAHRACQRVGTRFRGGVYYVPRSKLDELTVELDTHVEEHRQRAEDLRANITALVEAFASDHPRWSDAIRRGAPSGDELALHADYLVLPFQAVDGFGEQYLDDAALTMSDNMFAEVASDASLFMRESIEGRAAKDGVTQKAVRPLRRMRDKLDGMAFLDSRIRPMVDVIDQALASLPKTGRIQNRDYLTLWTLASSMADAQKLANLHTGLVSDDPMFSTVDDVPDDEAFTEPSEPEPQVIPLLTESNMPEPSGSFDDHPVVPLQRAAGDDWF